MTTFIRFCACFVSVMIGATAFAHDPGLSSAHVMRTRTGLELRLSFAARDLATFAPATRNQDQSGVTQRALLTAAAEFVRVYGESGLLRAALPQSVPADSNTADTAVLLTWPDAPAVPLKLEFPVLAQLPFGHRMVLTVENSPDPVVLLDRKRFEWKLPANLGVAATYAVETTQPSPKSATWFSFLALGVEHILTGFDHLCFLFALLLVAVRPREMLAVVTTFTVAHSLTLAAAATGFVSLSPRVVEPMIAASIVYIGVENLLLRRAPRHRLALVFCFGLVHGLGFASALSERLPGMSGFAVVLPLLGFNAGVELGQLAVATCAIPMLRFARSRASFAPRLQPSFSLAIAIAGAVWFYQRV